MNILTLKLFSGHKGVPLSTDKNLADTNTYSMCYNGKH